jgi:hypothetical protein
MFQLHNVLKKESSMSGLLYGEYGDAGKIKIKQNCFSRFPHSVQVIARKVP